LVVGVGALLMGCGAPLNCTTVGCDSAVLVDIASLSTTARPISAEATLCVGGECKTETVSFLTQTNTELRRDLPSEPMPKAGMQVPVTLKVVQGSAVLLSTTATAVLAENAPNGTECGPICYSASLVLNGQTLQQSPPPTASG
jgi:hypothetical protein